MNTNNSKAITSKDPISQLLLAQKITNWPDLMSYVKQLPYGRNSNRNDLKLVFHEKKGSCSSKHAFLKMMAIRNNIPGVKLILAIYNMNQKNTAHIGDALSKNKLDYIPEAHCYIKLNDMPIDLTSKNSHIDTIAEAIVYEEEIMPEQVVNYKVKRHKAYLKEWLDKEKIQFCFDELWEIREQCIRNIEARALSI